ncbi:hypothetical protein EHS25_008895 [Saitozyma podzolica]|uniref:Uncharacterized protein n=1 Tax=Saitozyma podzolica TaxID=1890683 RepID=A0A427YN47_9TREE|nr:hypothetical protein EHS25_008895 [Saitozyma podzolica]
MSSGDPSHVAGSSSSSSTSIPWTKLLPFERVQETSQRLSSAIATLPSELLESAQTAFLQVANEVANWKFDKVWDLAPSTNTGHFERAISTLETILVDAIRTMSEPEVTGGADSATDTAINATCSALEAFTSQLHALDKHEQAVDDLNSYGKIEFSARMTNVFIYYRFPRESGWKSLAKQANSLYKTFNSKSQTQATLREPESRWTEAVSALSTRVDEYGFGAAPENGYGAKAAATRSLGKLREYGEAVQSDLKQHDLIRQAIHDAFFPGLGGRSAGSVRDAQ